MAGKNKSKRAHEKEKRERVVERCINVLVA